MLKVESSESHINSTLKTNLIITHRCKKTHTIITVVVSNIISLEDVEYFEKQKKPQILLKKNVQTNRIFMSMNNDC